MKLKFPDRNILIVAHAFATRVINSYFEVGEWDRSCENLRLKNCEIKKYRF